MVSGGDEMLANLRRMEIQAPLKAKRTIKEAQDLYVETLKSSDLPYDPETATHIRTSIKKGSVTDHGGEYSGDIGYGNDVGWYVHFPDLGTSKQRAQGFNERAKAAATPKILALYAKSLQLGGD